MPEHINQDVPEPLSKAHTNVITLDRHLVLTQGKSLVMGMPYLYSKGSLITDKFQHQRGFFIIYADCIMTKNQIINVQGEYQLVDFKDGGDIQYRQVEFWHAVMKDGLLKIIVYDIGNKVIISRLHDIEDRDAHCDWVLIDTDFFESDNKKDELLDFDF